MYAKLIKQTAGVNSGTGPHIGMLAGEASGDLLGGDLITALRARLPTLTCSGIGGTTMCAAGFESRHEMDRLSVMGFIDPLKRLPELLRIRRDIKNYLLREKPAVFVGIDSPDFNLGLELELKKAGIPVVHYVSPSVWAWRPKRIHKIARAVDLVLALFPFEADFYQKHQVPVRYVGHPLADRIQEDTDGSSQADARRSLGLDPDAPILGILPGSREGECRLMLPVFLAAAERCLKERKELCVISASASAARHREMTQLCEQLAPGLPIRIFSNCAEKVMRAADVLLVTSGTATLEAMLCGRPMVIAYRMPGLVYSLVRHLVKVPFVGLPNLLAGSQIVPEFIQNDATPDNLAAAVMTFLNDPEKGEVLRERFSVLHKTLKCDAKTQAADAVVGLLTV